jgi:hypothetical protein
MPFLAQAGLTAPAVAGRGLSEGLGASSGALNELFKLEAPLVDFL